MGRIKIMVRHSYLSCLLLAILISGCTFHHLEKELTEYEASFGLIGKVEETVPGTGPVVVALYQKGDAGTTVIQYLIVDSTRHYSFIVREGVYYIAAFEDANNNLIYDEGETYGHFGKPDEVTVDAQAMASAGTKSRNALDITLKQKSGYPAGMPRSVAKGSLAARSFKKVGIVAALDDEIFDQENGALGYWKPLSFLKEIGIGIFFLEPYDPDKTPVLFVHGANGTPVGWKPMVAKLDRRRYQPWFYYYPSGLELDTLAKALNILVKELHTEHRFNRLHVVAHSMGGLVSRAFIIKNMAEDQQSYIETFVSISTPWGGVGAAALGVKHAPAVVPNWHDISPDSEFLQYMYEDQLPYGLKFYLLFGVHGECSMMMANNDGTVEIASEIDYRAQADATGFYGFDEDHISILTSDRVIDQVLELIDAGGQ